MCFASRHHVPKRNCRNAPKHGAGDGLWYYDLLAYLYPIFVYVNINQHPMMCFVSRHHVTKRNCRNAQKLSARDGLWYYDLSAYLYHPL